MLATIFATIWKRRVWAIAGLLLGLATGIWVARHEPKEYEATGRLIITRAVDPSVRVGIGARRVGKVRFGNEMLRMRDDAVLNQVVRDLDLMNDPDFAEERKRHPDGAALRRGMLNQLRTGLFISAETDNSVVDITYTSLDPEFAAQVVNALMQAFIRQTYEENVERVARASQAPANQLALLKAEVEATQVQLIAAQRGLGGSNGFVVETTRNEKALDTLTLNVVEAGTERGRAAALYQRLTAGDARTREQALDSLPDPARSQEGLLAELDDARVERAALTVELGPKHPQVLAVSGQIAELERAVGTARARRLEAARVAFLQAKANQTENENALAGETDRLYGQGPQSARYGELLRQFSFTRVLYTLLYTRLRTAALQAGLHGLNLEVLDLAQVPMESTTPPAWLYLTQFSLLGLLLGSLTALGVQNLRSGLRNLEEVEAVTQLPALATLPRLAESGVVAGAVVSVARRNLAVIEEPRSRFADGIGNLQMNLQLSGAGAEPKYVLFTSATPSEGKTTVAGNYAVTLAQTGPPGTRVLLIDADLHRPNLHHRFGLHGRVGLSTVLSGSVGLEEALQRIVEVPALDILAGGPVPPSPYLLLSSPAYLRLLRQAGHGYTHIVIDSPPVLAVADVIVLARLVDAVVYVVRHGKGSKEVVRRGRDVLAAADVPLAGVVLNGLEMRDDEVVAG